jgi:lysophospholipase L1-like esterase
MEQSPPDLSQGSDHPDGWAGAGPRTNQAGARAARAGTATRAASLPGLPPLPPPGASRPLPGASLPPASRDRFGVLAFGDSITNGGGELQWGVALQSWALWLARGLGLPYSGYAADAAQVPDVLSEQIPAFLRRAVHADGPYDIGCLYIGVNDVRDLRWHAESFSAGFEAALAFLAARCERVLTITPPLDLGRPRAGAKVAELGALIRAAARAHSALVLDLSHFRARNLVMTDHVHPTAFGQIAIAERALELLAADGVHVRVRPSQLIRFETSRRGRLRGDLAYLYRHAKVTGRSLRITALTRLRAVVETAPT